MALGPNGKTIFIPFTAPGDLVEVEILEEKKNYSQGKLVEILEPSPERVNPPCPVFTKCGGCQWQHIPYELQWKTKFLGLKHALGRAQVQIPLECEEFPATVAWGYRNRVQLRGFSDRLGFYAPGSHNVISVEECKIAHPLINAQWNEIKLKGKELKTPYKVEVELTQEPQPSVKTTWNAPHAALGFSQVNNEQNEKLKSWISQNITRGSILLDLYGGSGNLSMPFSPKMKTIYCIDTYASLQKNSPANYFFIRSGVLPWLMAQKKLPQDGSAILDPPREGLGPNFVEMEHALKRLGVVEIVLVGCDADSWAKDLSRFVKKGWKLKKISVFDFFPQTPHVEAVGLLLL